MSKVAFSLGPLDFYWYGLIVAAAVLIGLIAAVVHAKLRQRSTATVIDLVLYGVPAAIIGARLFYVILNWPMYLSRPGEIFYVWRGGLVGYGALIGFILASFLYTRRHQLDLAAWLDIIAPGLAIGLAIGQWGNFINQEGFGYPTNLPWGIYIDYAYRPLGYEQYDYFQPLFLYESVWNIVILLVLVTIAFIWGNRLSAKPGRLFAVFLLLFSLGRLTFESLRLDTDGGTNYYILQLMSSVCAALALWLLFRRNNSV